LQSPTRQDKRDEPQGLIVGCPLLILRRDPAKLLAPVHEPLHYVTLAVDGPVERPDPVFIGLAWDGAPASMPPPLRTSVDRPHTVKEADSKKSHWDSSQRLFVSSPSKLKARTFRATFRLPAIDQTSKMRASKPVHLYRNPVTLAQEWQGILTKGECSSLAALARRLELSLARVAQVLQLLKLTPKVLDVVTGLGDPLPSSIVTERRLRSLANLTVEEQCRRMDMILANKR
jgi:hypothetical protein